MRAFAKRVPALVAGILLLFWAPSPVFAATPLWRTFFEEGDWTGARREALREGAGDPTAAVIADACRLRIGRGNLDAAMTALEAAARDPEHPAAATAALERGRHALRKGQPDAAWPWMARAFLQTRDPEEFLAAGTALAALARRDRRRLADQPALAAQLEATRGLWTLNRIRAVQVGGVGGGWLARAARFPARTVVRAYRSAIRPAIGSRCNLHPSCSEYFLVASRRNGLLGFPMIADRLIREPGVVQRAEREIMIGGQPRIADPVEEHEFWRMCHE
jgi:hypothetical protein